MRYSHQKIFFLGIPGPSGSSGSCKLFFMHIALSMLIKKWQGLEFYLKKKKKYSHFDLAIDHFSLGGTNDMPQKIPNFRNSEGRKFSAIRENVHQQKLCKLIYMMW